MQLNIQGNWRAEKINFLRFEDCVDVDKNSGDLLDFSMLGSVFKQSKDYDWHFSQLRSTDFLT